MENKSTEEQLRSVFENEESIRRIAQGDRDLFKELMRKVGDEERRRFLHYKPYNKQLEFHASHATERILSGANQSGKSLAGCMETCFHLTGNYPGWWPGHGVKPRKNGANGGLGRNGGGGGGGAGGVF